MKARILFVGMLFCFGSVVSQRRASPVCVLDATKQNWISGAPGGRSGTNYRIKVHINTSRSIEFLYLWIGKENVPLSLEFYNLDGQKQLALGDSLLLFSSKVVGEEFPMFEHRKLPVRYKGAALFQCVVDRKNRYFIVKELRQLPPLAGQ
ncbi:MAG: hypothetical protein IPP77_14700 [Bacteroidetes bacterium]|nr:hypothetical protein [Bacteroidota bacterium]